MVSPDPTTQGAEDEIVMTFECHVSRRESAEIGDDNAVARWVGDLLNDYGIGYRLVSGPSSVSS